MPPLGIRKAGVALPAAAPALRLRMAVARRGGRLAAGGTARAPRRRTVPVAPLAKIVSDESFEEKGTVSEGQAGPTGTDDLLEKSATLEVPRRKRVVILADSLEEELVDGRCRVFVDRDGEISQPLCCDYGFREGVARMYEEGVDGQIPKSAFELAIDNFRIEYGAMRRSFRFDEYKVMRSKAPQTLLTKANGVIADAVVRAFAWADVKLEALGILPELPEDPVSKAEDKLSSDCKKYRELLDLAVLSNDNVWAREEVRDKVRGPDFTPAYVRVVYLALCYFLDFYFDGRPIQRFWFLETVARMPYFSYITMLHGYESLGWWRAGAKLRKVHFAEEWNELHHLMIMESLGGDRYWLDRFMAGHAAVVYFVILCGLFFFNPKVAYNFSELIEGHAVDTYGEFVDANEKLLKQMPPPYVALSYYRGSDLYLFDYFQTYQTAKNEPRRPRCSNLYDVFSNIRDDEGQHVETMAACQDQRIIKDFQDIEENIKY